MDIWLIFFSSILFFFGLIGCFIPILPGPPLTFGGILLLHFTQTISFEMSFLWQWGLVVLAVTLLDYLLPIWATKWAGGSKAGVRGSTFGLIIGLFFFPPVGLVIGPLIGALMGELMAGQERSRAIRSALGAFLGFLTGTMAKLAVSAYLTFVALQALF